MVQRFFLARSSDIWSFTTAHMNLTRFVLLFIFIFSPPAWSTVFVQWSNSAIPPSTSLGINDIVLSSRNGFPVAQAATARKQGFHVYVEASLKQASATATSCARNSCSGIILNIPEAESAQAGESLTRLRSTYPKLRFLVLSQGGKQPEMRGSLVIKRDAVLEVSSPTAQPWIDSNLALIKVEHRALPSQVPLYTFSWADSEQQRPLIADDYSLAVGEAGALHADLVLQLSEDLQKGLTKPNSDGWTLWNRVRPMLKFAPDAKETQLQPAANVAVVVDQLDASDEALNLLGRHNIPFQLLLSSDLKAADLKGFDILILMAKPDAETADRIKTLANSGTTVVVVDAHGKFPWQSGQPVKVNDQTTSYAAGSGKVLELAEPVTDPETFAQDIRRLLGKRDTLFNLWNGLTTIAVPYKDPGGSLKLMEFVNYAGEPVRLQVQVKGTFSNIRYETPERGCCQTLEPVKHDGFTEFVLPELNIAGRVHLDAQ